MSKSADQTATAAIILAAGLGTRMKSDLPKVLHPLAGRPMILGLLESVAEIGAAPAVVVVSDERVADAVAPHPTARQGEQLGTGHAVLQARDALTGFDGNVLILFGADPLITPDTLQAMLARRRAEDAPGVVVLGFRPHDPALYGRLVCNDAGMLEGIVEARDATPSQLEIGLCNSGVMCVDGRLLFSLLDRVGNDNAKGEYYLTDIVALARADGLGCAVIEGDAEELIGIDDRIDLARAETIMQNRLRERAMQGGATLIDPASVTFSFDTSLGQDVTIGPNVVFGPGVDISNGVTIRPFCHIEGASVADGAVIGPFARLRPGAKLAENVRVGNFVEIKNATLETGAKVNHLTYVGDARVGEAANIGAGTITCNYDGFAKHFTDIGAGAFIGSNTALVAPVKIGDGAIIGAGSTIAKDVAGDALAVTRATQRQVDGWAGKFRSTKKAKKDKA
ncbi:MAG: bifunctional UDP-N-acetylglucosamine diphosphorylase/glucosamine-1-phosphate N-acetyltransferase GlmU [Rhodospirillaceae bacterium]|nr:bifunctional UDP-N-acetylglucosamine diphosphorylase/glucosamine-1-phosphate N-acetyltransferase GlmU [Rhodospirillaceae bacterium]